MPLAAAIHRSSDPTGLFLWCVVGFCAGIALFVYGFRLLQRRRLILDTPFSKIRSASLGMVEISGLATGPYTMLAPVTGHGCYYYRTLVWEWKQQGKSKQWVKIAAECMHLPFFVDDNTGQMLIDPHGADLDLHRDFQQEYNDSFFSMKDAVPDKVRALLARHGVVTNNKIKVEEFCIKPKNALFILGTLAENRTLEVSPHPIRDEEAVNSVSIAKFSLSLRPMFSSTGENDEFNFTTVATPGIQRGDSIIRLSPDAVPTPTSEMTQQQKIAAALIRAGISSPAAWAAAGVDSGQVSDTQVLSDSGTAIEAQGPLNGFVRHPPVVLKKGENNKTFLISWRSQQEVARSLAWKCTLMIWTGPVLALLSLYILLSITKLVR